MKKSLALQIILFSLFCVILLTSCFPSPSSGFTISFVSNGGSSCSSVNIGPGENSFNLPTPVKEGNLFVGWFTDKLLTVSWSQYLETHQNTVSSNMSLYAKWAPISGNITLDVNGGKGLAPGLSPVQYAEGIEISLPVPTRTGNTFEGWFDIASYTGCMQITDETGLLPDTFDGEGNMTFYAHWVVKVDVYPYEAAGTVTKGRGYYIIGGSSGLDKLNFSATPVTHYTFLHWLFGEDKITDNPYTHTFTEDVEITAVFQGAESVLTANPNFGGGESQQNTVHYGETFTLMVPTNPGYVFNGWYTDASAGTKISDRRGNIVSYPYYNNFELYAHWQEGTFTTDFEYQAVGSPAQSYSITGYTGSEENIYIPYDLGGIPVTAITNSFNAAGYGANGAKKIIIPSSITSIGQTAFASYAGNIYFDRGFSSLSIIDTPTFNTSHNIFVHGTYVTTGNISSSPHVNSFAPDTKVALIDDIYFDFLGHFADSHIGDQEELQAFINYIIVYTVPHNGERNIAFTVEYSALSDEMGKAINNVKYYRSNTDLYPNISYSFTDNRAIITSVKEKTTGLMASATTDYPDTIEIPAFINSYATNPEPETRSFAIDSNDPYVVFNTEQLVYAVENGFKPVFFEEGTAKEIYNGARSILEEIIPTGADTFEKLTIIHDWIALNNKYDHELLNLSTQLTPPSDILTYNGFYLDGIFIDKKAVCDGISKAFMLMARIEGIEAIRVSGTTTEGSGNVGHAWNKVKILNEWYGVDLTGDDVSIKSGDSSYYEVLSHRYFLISDSLMLYKNLEDPDFDNPFYVFHNATGIYNYYTSTKYDASHDLYVQTPAEQVQVKDAFFDFVNLQSEPGRYAIELVFSYAHVEGTSDYNYYNGFGSCTHTQPAEIGETEKYFVIIMLDKS